MEQVPWALLDNAMKYGQAGTPVSVSIGPDGAALSITVRDTGLGMDRATRRQAFDQFYRAPDARRLAPDRSGGGLYAVHWLMDRHGRVDLRRIRARARHTVHAAPTGGTERGR